MVAAVGLAAVAVEVAAVGDIVAGAAGRAEVGTGPAEDRVASWVGRGSLDAGSTVADVGPAAEQVTEWAKPVEDSSSTAAMKSGHES